MNLARTCGWIAALSLLAGVQMVASELTLAPAAFRSHSHNDYAQARPLFEALDHRMGSVEADVFFIGGDLLVAHARNAVSPERTLRRLYLEPLRARCEARGGRVYPDASTLILLIDIKADPVAVHQELLGELQTYAPLLTRWREGKMIPGAITVLLSGDRPRAAVEADPDRCMALDGRLEELEKNPPVTLVPLVSESWGNVFSWKGTGPMPAAEQSKLRALVVKAHAQGRWLRFWAAPDSPACWQEQFSAGVDFINTDHPALLEAFLRETDRR
jgi:hypothetical protein